MAKKVKIGAAARFVLGFTGPVLVTQAAKIEEPLLSEFLELTGNTLSRLAEAGAESSDEGSTVTKSEIEEIITSSFSALQAMVDLIDGEAG